MGPVPQNNTPSVFTHRYFVYLLTIDSDKRAIVFGCELLDCEAPSESGVSGTDSSELCYLRSKGTQGTNLEAI